MKSLGDELCAFGSELIFSDTEVKGKICESQSPLDFRK